MDSLHWQNTRAGDAWVRILAEMVYFMESLFPTSISLDGFGQYRCKQQPDLRASGVMEATPDATPPNTVKTVICRRYIFIMSYHINICNVYLHCAYLRHASRVDQTDAVVVRGGGRRDRAVNEWCWR